MSNEKIKPHVTANHSISPKLKWMNNSRIRVEFKGSCLNQNIKTFTPRNVVNLFIVYEFDIWSSDLNSVFTLKDCLLGPVELTINGDTNKYPCSWYGIGVDSRLLF